MEKPKLYFRKRSQVIITLGILVIVLGAGFIVNRAISSPMSAKVEQTIGADAIPNPTPTAAKYTSEGDILKVSDYKLTIFGKPTNISILEKPNTELDNLKKDMGVDTFYYLPVNQIAKMLGFSTSWDYNTKTFSLVNYNYRNANQAKSSTLLKNSQYSLITDNQFRFSNTNINIPSNVYLFPLTYYLNQQDIPDADRYYMAVDPYNGQGEFLCFPVTIDKNTKTMNVGSVYSGKYINFCLDTVYNNVLFQSSGMNSPHALSGKITNVNISNGVLKSLDVIVYHYFVSTEQYSNKKDEMKTTTVRFDENLSLIGSYKPKVGDEIYLTSIYDGITNLNKFFAGNYSDRAYFSCFDNCRYIEGGKFHDNNGNAVPGNN